MHRRYKALARQEKNVRFGVRLSTYKYLDMHQAIGSALADTADIIAWLSEGH